MSTAQTNDFQIETETTLAIIDAKPTEFAQILAKLFQDHRCQVGFFSLNKTFDQEPDYALFLATENFNLQTVDDFLTRFPHTKTFLLIPAGQRQQFLTPPPSPITSIYLGEIYDCHFLDPLLAPYLFHFFRSANQEKKLTLPGDGLFPVYPLSQQDFIKALEKIIFDPYLDHHQLSLQSLHDISLLSLAYQLQPLFPFKINLEFNANLQPIYPDLPKEIVPFQNFSAFIETDELKNNLSCLAKLNLQSQTKTPVQFVSPPPPTAAEAASPKPKSYRPRLKPLFPKPTQPKSIEEIKRQVEFVKLPVPKQSRPSFHFQKKLKRFRPFLKFALLGLGIYLLTLFLALASVFVVSQKMVAGLKRYRLPSKTTLNLVQIPLSYLNFNLKTLSQFPILKNSASVQQLTEISSLTLNPGFSILRQAGVALPQLKLLHYHLLGKKTLDFPMIIKNLSQSLDSLYADVSLLSLKLPEKLSPGLPPRLKSLYPQSQAMVNQSRHYLAISKLLVPALPQILGGVGESKKYLVLFQNNMELRPTGGFIGSFAILDFANAQLLDFKVFDVYQADGQLKGHVKPPDPIKRYLDEANWYLRDSNWDPNFPVTAKRAEWFAQKTLKQNFDGVIAIDLNYVQSLLKRLGPIELPDYHETITADNLFERAEYHSEVGSFPGSMQKKNFLANLANQLFIRLKQSNSVHDLAGLLNATFTSLNSRDIQIYLNDSNLNSIFDLLNWSGRLKSPQCPLNQTSNCLQDYLYLVDANLGVNKANYFIRRSLNLDITISKQKQVSHQLMVTYTNTATNNEWPAGPYKNYQRLYLPYDVVLDSVFLNQTQLSQDDLDVTKQAGKTVVGYLVQVPINQTLVVRVNYHLNQTLSSSSPVYSLYWQRQSGTGLDPLGINLHYPLYLQPKIISPQAEVSPQTLRFNLVSSQDRRILVQFSQ